MCHLEYKPNEGQRRILDKLWKLTRWNTIDIRNYSARPFSMLITYCVSSISMFYFYGKKERKVIIFYTHLHYLHYTKLVCYILEDYVCYIQ